MGPVEISIRELAVMAKRRLATPPPKDRVQIIEKDRVQIIEEELRQLKRQVLLLTMKLANAKYQTKEGIDRAAVERIIEMVCTGEKISRLDIVSKRRTREIVRPRQICFYLAATQTIASLPTIGAIFNKSDHTTVLHAKKKISELRQRDEYLNKKLIKYEIMIDDSTTV